MKKERNRRPQRKMKPVFLVFCEGNTEETYINFLRQKYRLPIRVISRITGQSISPKYIQRIVQSEKIGNGDMITSFLMYDLDSNEVVDKLKTCNDSINISSNPVLELWFLLHNIEQNAAITSDNCIKKLINLDSDWASYEKGYFSEKQKQLLWEKELLNIFV